MLLYKILINIKNTQRKFMAVPHTPQIPVVSNTWQPLWASHVYSCVWLYITAYSGAVH